MLSVLGVSSCFPVLMYGTPTSTYKLKGTVSDETGKGINNIQVEVCQDFKNVKDQVILDNPRQHIVTVYTDAHGKFETDQPAFPYSSIKLIFEDVDGEENGGEFQKDSLSFKTEFKGGKGWDSGTFKKDNINITLKKD